MFHLIAHYKNTYYYFGCTVDHVSAVALFDFYMQRYPKIDKLHTRWHPYADMIEHVKDFSTFELFEKAYKEDNL